MLLILKDTQQIQQHSWQSLTPLLSPRKMRWHNSCFSLWRRVVRRDCTQAVIYHFFLCCFSVWFSCCFFWRHTSGVVKRDEFVGLDVVDQGRHRFVSCHFLSGCALQFVHTRMLRMKGGRQMMWSTLYLIWRLHFLLILLLRVLLLLGVLRSSAPLWFDT